MSHNPFIQGRKLGDEGELLLIIDDFHPDPDLLIRQARGRTFGTRGRFYPGIRATAAPEHLSPCQSVLREVLTRGYGLEGAQLTETSFSMVTTPPDALLPMQRLPHFDGTHPNRLALLHYLIGPEEAGTAFFRHRETSFESIVEARLDTYQRSLQTAYPHGPTKRYFSGSDTVFEQIDFVPAKFNRAILYRGICLHSGIIPETFNFSDEIDHGRLTINTFLEGR